MTDLKLGWFDVFYWIVAFAVSYYLAFVFDFRKFFKMTKKEDQSKVKGPVETKEESFKLEKVWETRHCF